MSGFGDDPGERTVPPVPPRPGEPAVSPRSGDQPRSTAATLDVPAHVSDDPGRPDGVIEGEPGAMLVIISGPSGVGKDTIIDAMRERTHSPEYVYVVTCTTRAPRPDEVDGVDYQFLSREDFLRLRAARQLLEANEVHGNWYGAPRDQVRRAVLTGRHAVLKIDVQGAQVVKEQVTEALLIFMVPPTLETLFSRLVARATESADELELRQRNAAIELARQDDYDYVVVNETGQVERTAERIDEIIAAERILHADRRVRV